MAFNPLLVNPFQSYAIDQRPLTNVFMPTVRDKDVPVFDITQSVWKAGSGLGPLFSVGPANFFFTSNGVTNDFRALTTTPSDITGNGQDAPLGLPTQGAAATGLVGLQTSIDTKGRITGYSTLDSSVTGGGIWSSLMLSYFNTTQNIASSTVTTLLFNSPSTAYFQSVPSWMNGGTGIGTIPRTGWWRIVCNGYFPGNAGGSNRLLYLIATTSNPARTDQTMVQGVVTAGLATGPTINWAFEHRFTVNDTFHLIASQDSGVTLALTFNVSAFFCSNSSP